MPTDIVKVFENADFGALRATKDEGGNPLFCAKDVALALGYKRPSDAIQQHCRGAVIYRPIVDSLGRKQRARFISEGDMYRLTASSKLESAVGFEKWVFDDVLPSIRKDGGYMVAREDESDEQVMARALLIAQKAITAKDKRIAELEPKARFADAVRGSEDTCLVADLAKILTQNNFTIGQNRLFSRLREDGYLGTVGGHRNVPTQRAMEMGLFFIRETTITHSDGRTTVKKTPRVTQKGVQYFVKKYCGLAS